MQGEYKVYYCQYVCDGIDNLCDPYASNGNFSKKINDKRVQSFLYYVPYAVLSAMTFPAIFSSTGSEVSAVVGCVVAIVLAYMKRGLLTVAVGAAGAVFLVQMIGF